MWSIMEGNIELVKVRYNFQTLLTWYKKMSSLVSIEINETPFLDNALKANFCTNAVSDTNSWG